MTLIALKNCLLTLSLLRRKIIAEVSSKTYHVVRTKLNIFLKGFLKLYIYIHINLYIYIYLHKKNWLS